MPERTYSQEEVDAILERALRAQSKDGSRLTHEELVAAAGEVGIPKDAIDAAAAGARAEATDKAIVAAWKRRARLGFLRHFVTYVLASALLAAVNFATGTAVIWFPIVLLAWGIGIAMHLISVLFADEERIVTRERRKIARRERRERWRKRGADFERAVDQGVRALIEIANSHGARVDVPPERVRVAGEPAGSEDEEHAQEDEKKRRR